MWGQLSRRADIASPNALVLAGLRFRNRFGIAAGFDKDAIAARGCQRLGVGFVEVGTVTPQPQSGNPKPRLFRIKSHNALINRLGFNGRGAEQMARELERTRHQISVPIGINLGANRDTPLDRAVLDYEACISVLYPYADYFSLNVSSPNTPGLRELQSAMWAEDFLGKLVEFRNALALDIKRKIPLFVKISPDMSQRETCSLVQTIVSAGCDGLIATNTTVSRGQLSANDAALEGGLSGPPLLERSLKTVRLARETAGKDFPIVGVGGIHSVESARRMIAAGANLLQLYTALVYQGPALLAHLIQALVVHEKEVS